MAEVTVYVLSGCGYCLGAKRFLDELGIEFREVSLDGKPELRAQLARDNGGWRTVPMILVGETFVGGFDDLRRLHQEGELEPLIQG